jgi:hypothetical protein
VPYRRRLFPGTELGCPGGFGGGYTGAGVEPTPSFSRMLLSGRSRGDSGNRVPLSRPSAGDQSGALVIVEFEGLPSVAVPARVMYVLVLFEVPNRHLLTDYDMVQTMVRSQK